MPGRALNHPGVVAAQRAPRDAGRPEVVERDVLHGRRVLEQRGPLDAGALQVPVSAQSSAGGIEAIT
jgi:hypothetical protein